MPRKPPLDIPKTPFRKGCFPGGPVAERKHKRDNLHVYPGSYVYFIQSEHTKLIKIGFSRRPVQRLRHLASRYHHKMTLLLVIPGSRRSERCIHIRFRAYWHGAEWFRPGPRLMSYIPRFREQYKDLWREVEEWLETEFGETACAEKETAAA